MYLETEEKFDFLLEITKQVTAPDFSPEESAGKLHGKPGILHGEFEAATGISLSEFLEIISPGNLRSLLNKGFRAPAPDFELEIIPMTAQELSQKGKNLKIQYSTARSKFGNLFLASTPKGICKITFYSPKTSLDAMKTIFPNADFVQKRNEFHKKALSLIHQNTGFLSLHVKATSFQLRVWNQLLQIPFGHLASYSQIAKAIGMASGARAVGTAVGKNPVACLIPCHRVIQTSGELGGYKWGKPRKAAILGMEQIEATI